MIPEFDPRGQLPPGIHVASVEEVREKFAYNRHRRELFDGLTKAMNSLKHAGCKVLFLDGSFVTDKKLPNDFDGCFDPSGMNFSLLDPILCDLSSKGRVKQKNVYKGELFLSTARSSPFINMKEFFQMDRDGNHKGIIQVNL